MIYIITIIFSAIMQGLAIAFMKKAAMQKHNKNNRSKSHLIYFTLCGILFFISFPMYTIGLSALNLGIAQPTFSAVIFVTSSVLSILIFKEKINIRQIAGIVVIVSGIVTVIS